MDSPSSDEPKVYDRSSESNVPKRVEACTQPYLTPLLWKKRRG